jgi:hypothetical protein
MMNSAILKWHFEMAFMRQAELLSSNDIAQYQP